MKGRTQTEGIAENNIWTEVGINNRGMEKTAQLGVT
jgi:hypothetical protein